MEKKELSWIATWVKGVNSKLDTLESQVKDLQEAVSTLIKDKLDEDDMFAMPSEEAQKRAIWKSELEKLHG